MEGLERARRPTWRVFTANSRAALVSDVPYCKRDQGWSEEFDFVCV